MRWGDGIQERLVVHLRSLSVLPDFCGGLDSVLTGTATVEIDFSIVKYVNNDFHTSLTDFSLEGILHAKKFRLLQAIDTHETLIRFGFVWGHELAIN